MEQAAPIASRTGSVGQASFVRTGAPSWQCGALVLAAASSVCAAPPSQQP